MVAEDDGAVRPAEPEQTSPAAEVQENFWGGQEDDWTHVAELTVQAPPPPHVNVAEPEYTAPVGVLTETAAPGEYVPADPVPVQFVIHCHVAGALQVFGAAQVAPGFTALQLPPLRHENVALPVAPVGVDDVELIVGVFCPTPVCGAVPEHV